MKNLLTTLMVLLIVMAAGSAIAGAKLDVGDDGAYIDLGYRLQTYWRSEDTNLDFDKEGYESANGFTIRRARLRLKGVINDQVSVFLQTDLAPSSNPAGRKGVQLIDAFLTYKASPWFQFVMGRNMVPSSRQALTSSGALMALDRPLQVAHALNWGAGGSIGTGLGDIPVTPDAVRDNGLTLFGSNAVGDGGFKYYLGAYNGVQYEQERDVNGDPVVDADLDAVNDKTHVAARAQYNLWGAESGYYNSSTYLGKKKTLGIGISYSNQGEVGSSMATATSAPTDDRVLVDYSLITFDAFLELPSANGNSLTAEVSMNMPDYGDAVDFMRHQGTGYYAQVGYYLSSGFQPWFLYEGFGSDATANADGQIPGDFTSFRVGATYFIDGQHANIKLTYTSRTTDVPLIVGATAEDTVNTITLGFFTTY